MSNKTFEIIVSLAFNQVFSSALFLIIIFVGAFFYFRRNHIENLKFKINLLVIFAIIIRILNVLLLTGIQYYSWNQDQFSREFLNMPSKFLNINHGYFLYYCFGRFWLGGLIISIIVAFIFYVFLKFLKKFNGRFFDIGEIELGLLGSLSVGWPNFVIFIPAVFIFVVLVSILKTLFSKEKYTTLGWPFILAALAALIFGKEVINILNLGFLRIGF